MSLVLGIDIGTTSVKTLVIDQTLKHEWFSRKETGANIEHPLYKEQDTNKIMKCVDECLAMLLKAVGPMCMAEVSMIATCGQMHGCVFWNSHKIPIDVDLSASFDEDAVSNLITWQDPRCSEEFLATLPLSKNFPAPLSSGFGCATIMWLKKFTPHFLNKYDSCGTIGDYLVTRLCGLVKPVMSTHNAASWGYYNPLNRSWDLTTMMKANFPVEIIPVVACPGTSAGKLCSSYQGMTHETKVVIAMGDLQCSVKSCQIRPKEAVINIGTSAQLSVLVDRETKAFQLSHDSNANLRKPDPVTRVPYFGEKDLLTSASLNGGVVFAKFIDMLIEWTRQFDPDVSEEKIYENLIKGALNDSSSSQLQCTATVFGERHSPSAKASFRNIGVSDLHLPMFARSIVRGIFENLRSMFETGSYPIKDLIQLRACGGAFRKNALFKEIIQQVFPDVKISFMKDADAAFGAALSVFTST